MTSIDARNQAQEIAMEAVVIRADGTRENLGTIAYWHRNPLKRWSFSARRFITTGRRGRISGIARPDGRDSQSKGF